GSRHRRGRRRARTHPSASAGGATPARPPRRRRCSLPARPTETTSSASRHTRHGQDRLPILGLAVDPLLATVGDHQLRVFLLPHPYRHRVTETQGRLGDCPREYELLLEAGTQVLDLRAVPKPPHPEELLVRYAPDVKLVAKPAGHGPVIPQRRHHSEIPPPQL